MKSNTSIQGVEAEQIHPGDHCCPEWNQEPRLSLFYYACKVGMFVTLTSETYPSILVPKPTQMVFLAKPNPTAYNKDQECYRNDARLHHQSALFSL